MVWFGLVLIYDKPVWFGSKLFVNGSVLNGLVSPICKRFGFNGFIYFKQFGLVFIIIKWFGLVWFQAQETEPGPLLMACTNAKWG